MNTTFTTATSCSTTSDNTQRSLPQPDPAVLATVTKITEQSTGKIPIAGADTCVETYGHEYVKDPEIAELDAEMYFRTEDGTEYQRVDDNMGENLSALVKELRIKKAAPASTH